MDLIYVVGRCLDPLHWPYLFSLTWFILAEWFSQTSFNTVIKFFTVTHNMTRIFAILADVCDI